MVKSWVIICEISIFWVAIKYPCFDLTDLLELIAYTAKPKGGSVIIASNLLDILNLLTMKSIWIICGETKLKSLKF
jgi:hypothetical protein